MKNQTQNKNEVSAAEQKAVTGGSSRLVDSCGVKNSPSFCDFDGANESGYTTNSDGRIPMPFITLGLHEDGGMFTTF